MELSQRRFAEIIISWYLGIEILQLLVILKSKDIFHDFEQRWFTLLSSKKLF